MREVFYGIYFKKFYIVSCFVTNKLTNHIKNWLLVSYYIYELWAWLSDPSLKNKMKEQLKEIPDLNLRLHVYTHMSTKHVYTTACTHEKEK